MAGRKLSAPPSATPRFWRDAALPFVEARSVDDGRSVCYGRHSHETFSIGAITQGHCDYLNGRLVEHASAGSVVMMNPGDVHACNPAGGSPWSYHMLYVDTAWLAELQRELGFSPNRDFRPFSTTLTRHAGLHAELLQLHETLTNSQAEPLHKSSAALAFFCGLQQQLDPAPASSTASAAYGELSISSDSGQMRRPWTSPMPALCFQRNRLLAACWTRCRHIRANAC